MFPIPTYLLNLIELNLPYTLNHCHEPVTMLVITLDYWIFQMTDADDDVAPAHR